MPTRDTDPQLQGLLESLDLAAYLARTGVSRDRRRAQDIAAQARRAAIDLAPVQQAQIVALSHQVSTLALAARRDARRDSAGLGLSLLAALVGGICIGLLLELTWRLSEFAPELPTITVVGSHPAKGRAWVSLGPPGTAAAGHDTDLQPVSPPAAQGSGPDSGDADAPHPAPIPDRNPPPVLAPAKPVAVAPVPEPTSAVADNLSKAKLNSGSGHGAVGAAGSPGIGLPGGWARGYTALAHQAPMAFHHIGSEQDPQRTRAGRRQPGFEVGRTEVTQQQWVALMGLDLGSISGHWDHPAEAMSWCDALRYANQLSAREHLHPVYRVSKRCERGGTVRWDTQAKGFRLLTETEWLALAAEAGPPPPPAVWSTNANNRGVEGVDEAGIDTRFALRGLTDNAREWVWGDENGDKSAPPSATRWQARLGRHDRVVARGCGPFAKVGPTQADPWCRATYGGDMEPLGVGLRLARGRLPPQQG